jgi:hypothetical protein
MPGSVTLVGAGSIKQLIIPSSFAATIGAPHRKDTNAVTLAEFRIGRGGWIIQAKATIRAGGPNTSETQFILTSTESVNSLDVIVDERSKASTTELGYATLVAVLAVRVSTTALVALAVSEARVQLAELSNVIVTAIHQDDLAIFAL